MNETKPDKGPLRYRMYFWLMNVAFVCGVLGCLNEVVAYNFEVPPTDYSNQLVVLLLFIVFTSNFLLPFFLFVARFMRDEYAEQLWRRTLIGMGYVMAAVPLALFLIVMPLYGKDEIPADNLLVFLDHSAKLYNFMLGSWMAYMLLFVFIFQFLRWKDARA